jgi:hypothetical protein
MAAFGFTTDYTHILPAGISSWLIKSGKSGETGAVELAPIADATVKIATLSANDSRKRAHPFAFGLEARCKVLGTAKTSCLQKLNLLTGYMNTHQITAINGKSYTDEMGTYWKFVCDGNIDVNRYIEIGADVGLINGTSILDTILGESTLPASASSDYLYGLSPGTIYPASFSALTVRNAAETAWEVIGTWRNPSLTAELKVVKDGNLRSIGYAVDVQLSFEMMQTDDEIELLDTLAAAQTDFKATLQDGTIFTFADNMGLNFSFDNASDIDDIAFIKVTGMCTLTPAEFVACIS